MISILFTNRRLRDHSGSRSCDTCESVSKKGKRKIRKIRDKSRKIERNDGRRVASNKLTSARNEKRSVVSSCENVERSIGHKHTLAKKSYVSIYLRECIIYILFLVSSLVQNVIKNMSPLSRIRDSTFCFFTSHYVQYGNINYEMFILYYHFSKLKSLKLREIWSDLYK